MPLDADLQVTQDYVNENIDDNGNQEITGPEVNSAFSQLIQNVQDTRGVATQIAITVDQAGHGFLIGNTIYFNGTIYVKAKANVKASLGTFIVELVDAQFFSAVQSGFATMVGQAFTAGNFYHVSQSTAGLLTDTEPKSGYVNTIFLATGAETGFVLPFRAKLKPKILSPVADIPALNALTQSTDTVPGDFEVGDKCKVLNNGYGELEMRHFIYDVDAGDYDWVLISRWTEGEIF